MDLSSAMLDHRIPEIIAAAVRERLMIEPVWSCPAVGAPSVAAMSPAPANEDAAWQPLLIDETWGTPDDPAAVATRLPWDVASTGGSTHWLRVPIAVPPAWHGQHVRLELHWTGERLDQVESIVYLDGVAHAGLDWGHRSVELPRTGHANMSEVLIRSAVPFPRPFGGVELQLRDEAIYRLGHAMRVLLDTAQALALDTPASTKLLELLNHAYHHLDLREGYRSQRFAASAAEALDQLNGALAAMPPSSDLAPRLMATGHGHLDVAWLWPLWRTRQKAAHTVATALHLMERYPDYHFSMSQPQVYQYLKQDDLELYGRLKAAVAAGRFEPIGMMWVEPDCNVPSGESLVRQLVHGARFFAQEFPDQYGATASHPHVVWLPDVFGFNAALPQLLRGVGISCFMTTKLSWNQNNRMPADTFRWRGIDGSEVLAHLLTATVTVAPVRHPTEPQPFSYGGVMTGREVLGTWRHYQHKALNRELLYLFGHGDGGGGPAEEMLEAANVLARLPDMPQVQHGRVDRYFAELYDRMWDDPRLPTWAGELYLEYHRGTFTSQAWIKRRNRAAELLYREAEWLNAWSVLEGGTNRQAKLDTGWEKILLNQFHDILPGTSIAAVYADARVDHAEIAALGKAVCGIAMHELTGTSVAASSQNVQHLFNALPWQRTDIAHLLLDADAPEMKPLSDPDGMPIQTQLVEEAGMPTLFVAATVPGYGYTTLKLNTAGQPATNVASVLNAERTRLTSDELTLTFDDHGEIASLRDRRYDRELVLPSATLNQLVAYEDRPLEWDAWDIDHFYAEKPYPVHEIVNWEVIECGPLRTAIAITRRFGQSTIEQRICMWHHTRRIDFVTNVDWQERQTLLRALFPLNLNTTQATCEIQFGAVVRPTHRNTSWEQARFEVCAHRWVDLGEGDYGVALLNDGKYGHSFSDSTIGLSLLKSAIFPDPDADWGQHRFTYSLFPHTGDWRSAQVVRQAYELNAPLRTMHGSLPQPHQASNFPPTRSLLSTPTDHIVVETVKVAANSDGLIIRLYEAHNQRGPALLAFDRPVLSAEETDLLERPLGPVDVEQNTVRFVMRPFEVKTLRVRLALF